MPGFSKSAFRRLRAAWPLVPALALLAPFPAQATAALPAANERNAPLIMESADRFEGYRSRGEYVLSGKVRFRHGEMYVETEKAVWLKERNFLYCESGMRITRKGSLLTADRGTYDKHMGQATAEGNVFMRDSSGEVAATGQSLVYLRFRHLATLTGKPEVRRFYRSRDSLSAAQGAGKDSAAPGKDTSAASASKPDTLSIKGDIMTYDDSAQVAIADGNVVIHRDKLNITCKKAEYHDASDSLYLLGDPVMVLDDNRVKGRIMRLGMHGEEIKSLLVKGAAQAHSLEPATDTSAARQSNVDGDSLFLSFKEKAIDSVQVFKNAKGAYFDVDRPEFVNKMSGDYMVLRFSGKQVASANVLGGAKSSYFHFEKKRLKGKIDAEGDTIDFAFKDGRIDEVMVKGTAKGTYFGEKQPKAGKAASDGQAPDGEASDGVAPGGGSATQGPPPAPAPKNPAPAGAVPDRGRSAPKAAPGSGPSQPWRRQ